MPYKVGKKNSKGWPIKKHENGHSKTIAHSKTKKNAETSIRARYMAEHK